MVWNKAGVPSRRYIFIIAHSMAPCQKLGWHREFGYFLFFFTLNSALVRHWSFMKILQYIDAENIELSSFLEDINKKDLDLSFIWHKWISHGCQVHFPSDLQRARIFLDYLLFENNYRLRIYFASHLSNRMFNYQFDYLAANVLQKLLWRHVDYSVNCLSENMLS